MEQERIGPVQRRPRAWQTLLKDTVVLVILAFFCWGAESLVAVAVLLLHDALDQTTPAVHAANTMNWFYLFVAPATLVVSIVGRVTGLGLGKAAMLIVVVWAVWCVVLVGVRLLLP